MFSLIAHLSGEGVDEVQSCSHGLDEDQGTDVREALGHLFRE